MVEEAVVAERKKTEEIKASDLRPQAHFFELVKVQNPKTGKESHFLYWWNKDRKEVIREVVNSGGIRVGYAPLIENGADFNSGARKKITDVINSQRKKGLEITRHQKLNRELFEEGRVKEGMLIPYFEELIKDRGKNVDEAWQYYHDAEEKAVRAKAQEKTGKVYGKSVFSTSAKLKLEKQETNLGIALNEQESGLRFFNQYLNERIGVEKPANKNDSLFEIYLKYNRDLDNITGFIQTASLEEKVKLLQAYTDIFSKRLEIHHELAERRGYTPVKGIPEDYPVGKKPEVKEEIEEEKEKPPTEERQATEPEIEIENLENQLKNLKEQASNAGVFEEWDRYERLEKEQEDIRKKLEALRQKVGKSVELEETGEEKERIERVEMEAEKSVPVVSETVEGDEGLKETEPQPEPEIEAIEGAVKVEGPEIEEVEKEDLSPQTEVIPEKTLLDEIAVEIKSSGKFNKELSEQEVSEIFQRSMGGLFSKQKVVKGETSITSFNLKRNELSFEANSLITAPFEVDLSINYVVGRTTEIGKLAQKKLEIKVVPRGKLSLSQKIQAQAAKVFLNGKLMKPTETLEEGLNYEFQQRNSGVRVSTIRFELKEGSAVVSIEGERKE